MAKIRVGGRAASQVGGLLREISDESDVTADVRANAAYWSGAVQHTMDRRELQTLAWLLLDASREQTMPEEQRRSARYWAANLEARC